jgi:hypothetical protein
MPRTLTLYIATYSLWKGDQLEVRKRHRGKKRVAYGIRIGEQPTSQSHIGWVRGNQKPFAQATALDCVLASIEEPETKVRLIMRSEFLAQRIDMIVARLLKKQKGLEVRPLNEDEELWERVAQLWKQMGAGMRPFEPGREEEILTAMEGELRELFYRDPSPLETADACVPEIEAEAYARDQ